MVQNQDVWEGLLVSELFKWFRPFGSSLYATQFVASQNTK